MNVRMLPLANITKMPIMVSTYSSLYYHIIFSTNNRVKYLSAEIEQRLWLYIDDVARAHKMAALQVGGIEDHVHVLVMAPVTLSPSQIAQYIKSATSKWIHEEFPDMRQFAWQDGFGAFTVSKSNLPDVIRYIQNQREHHRHKTFQEEFLEFLQNHEIAYNDRHWWR